MAETLLKVVQDISRRVGLDPTITSFSESNDTNDLIRLVYKAYRDLKRDVKYNSLPFEKSGTISTVAGTRTYSLASDALPYGVYEWFMVNRTEDNELISYATKEYILRVYADFDTVDSSKYNKPHLYYFDSISTIGFYPIPDGVYSINYMYQQEITENLTTTATFLVPDSWLDYIKARTQILYESEKGFGDIGVVFEEWSDIRAKIIVDEWAKYPTYIRSSGVPGL